MRCTHCGLWELADGDLVCCWCGTRYLSYSVQLEPAEISIEDYPPPVELRIHNSSPMGALTLERIQTGAPWINLLPDSPLPQTIAPGTRHRFYLDVDTFAAGDQTGAAITVSASYAPEPETATLHLRRSAPASF